MLRKGKIRLKINKKQPVEALKDYKLNAEDAHPKHYTSPELGRTKPSLVGMFNTAIHAVKEKIRKAK